MVIKAHLVCCSCHLLLARCSYQSVVSFMHLQYSPQVISAGQENPNQGLLLDENVPGCSGGLCNTTQHMANTFSPCSTNQQPSFFALSRAHPCEDAGNYQRHKTLRSYGRQTIIKCTRDTNFAPNKLDDDDEKCDLQPANTRALAASWSTELNTTGSFSSGIDIPIEILPAIALIPPTPRGSVGSPALPPDSPITVQKFVTARSKVLLKRRSSFLSSAPPLITAPCLACSRPERLLSEDDLSCRRCRKQWLACQLWYQACDGGRMERLRVPFVRPGESTAVSRALLESLGLLPPSLPEKGSHERVAKPNHVARLCLSVLVKPFRSLVGRKA